MGGPYGHGLDRSPTNALHSIWLNSTQLTVTMATAAVPVAITCVRTGLAAKGAAMAISTTVTPLQLLPQLQAHMKCEEVL